MLGWTHLDADKRLQMHTGTSQNVKLKIALLAAAKSTSISEPHHSPRSRRPAFDDKIVLPASASEITGTSSVRIFDSTVSLGAMIVEYLVPGQVMLGPSGEERSKTD